MSWGSPEEIERRKRIQVSLWAYTYEYLNVSLVDDHTFDETCLSIDLKQSTGNPKMDEWFKKHFDPCTGQWIWKHPEKKKLQRLYERLTVKRISTN